MTAATVGDFVEVDEQSLRAKIAALDKKIEAQRRHISKLERELTDKRTERAHLIRQRIDLLQRELPTEGQ